MGGKKFNFFVRSYLGYGLNEVCKIYFEWLLKKFFKNGVIKSLCYYKGFNEIIDISGELFIVVGIVNVFVCWRIIEKMFFCKKSDCLFND